MDKFPRMPPDSDDYSIAKTIIPFSRPLPLLRAPVEAQTSVGSQYLLAFKSPRDWAAAYNRCKAQIVAQCESGARIGCSISASNKCRPPWWKFLLGTTSSKQDLIKRAKCEEIEMEACFSAAREKCSAFAREKCAPAFENAWIEMSCLNLEKDDWKEAHRLISGVCFVNEMSYGVGSLGVNRSWCEFRKKYLVSHVRGSDILGSDYADVEEYLKNIR